MSDIDKIIFKMKRQPNGIRFNELCKVLEHNGYKMKTRKRYVSQEFYKFKRRCYNYKRRKSTKGSLCKRYIKKNRRIN